MLTTSKRPPNAIAPGVESEQDQRNKILKCLLDTEDEKDNTNAFANKMNMPNQSPQQQQQQQQQRLANPRPVANDSKTDNPMLMHLLNHDDDNMDGRTNQRNNSELLRQLQKEDTPKDHHTINSNEELIQMLRFQGNEYSNRKRPPNEPEDGPLAKRSDDKPSKLREKNKMLASLLSGPSKAPTTFTTIPVVKTIPDIPQQSRIPERGFQVKNFFCRNV